MKNNQTIQHKPSQPEEPHLEETNKVNTKPSNFWTVYYWTSFAFLSAISLGIIIYGYNQLFNIDSGSQTRRSATITVQPKATSNRNSPPVWIIIAIALSCATGCLVTFRFFKLSEKVKNFTINRIKATNRQVSTLNLHHPSPETPPLTENMPEAETDIVNSNSESLADLLDIRKQTSISSMVQENE